MRALFQTLLLLAAPAAGAAADAVPQPAPPPAASSAASAGAAAPVVPSQALIEKLGEADRLFLAGDRRNALFAYLDAVYMEPRYAPARVRLGRTYLALRYPARAQQQAEAALAVDPGSAEAKALLEEARGGTSATAAAPRPILTAGSIPPATTSEAAAQHYRAGVAYSESHDWTKAIAQLSEALRADPNMAAGFVARGAAHLAIGEQREAASDFRNALFIDPLMAAPVYGLAECHRAAGDARNAAQMYQRYAQSNAPDVREELRAEAARRAKELEP